MNALPQTNIIHILSELLKGGILESRIPDIFKENSRHETKNICGILINFQKRLDMNLQMDSM